MYLVALPLLILFIRDTTATPPSQPHPPPGLGVALAPRSLPPVAAERSVSVSDDVMTKVVDVMERISTLRWVLAENAGGLRFRWADQMRRTRCSWENG
jgi:hypothetical protein